MHQAMQTVVQRKRAAHRKKQRLPLRLYLRESGPALAGKFGEAFLFFFLSLSECFRLPSPFAVCALCAWLYIRRGLLFPAAGLLLSLGLRLIWGVAIDPMQYAGCALLMGCGGSSARLDAGVPALHAQRVSSSAAVSRMDGILNGMRFIGDSFPSISSMSIGFGIIIAQTDEKNPPHFRIGNCRF